MNQKELNWSLKRSSIHCSFFFTFFTFLMGLKHHLLRYSDKLNEFSMLLCFGVMSPLPRLGSLPLSPHVTFWCFPLPPFLGWRHLWTVPYAKAIFGWQQETHMIWFMIFFLINDLHLFLLSLLNTGKETYDMC